MDEPLIVIRADGTVELQYDDALAPLAAALGTGETCRASHVEPDPGRPGTWYADMAPVGGPKLTGFATRGAALAAERDWLAAHYYFPSRLSSP